MIWRRRAARPFARRRAIRSEDVTNREAIDPARWVDVAGLKDLRDNRIVVSLDQVEILVVRSGTVLAAMENACPHLAQPLVRGRIRGGLIECPAHGYRWELSTGRPVRSRPGVAARPLNRVPVQAKHGRIFLARRTENVTSG